MPPAKGRYYRVSPQFWFWVLENSWGDDVIILALYMLTCEHRNTEGLFRFSKRVGAEDLNWADRRFAKSFGSLISDGFLEYDQRARVCWLVNAIEWQQPANPNQIKAAVRSILELPATPLLNRFVNRCETVCPTLSEALREPLAQRVRNTPSPTPPPSLHTSTATQPRAGSEDVDPMGEAA